MILGIKAQNYKSIKNASVMFPKFGAIIGKNGSGKSTLLSLIKTTKRLASGEDVQIISRDVAPLFRELFNLNNEELSSINVELYFTNKKGNHYRLNYQISSSRAQHRQPMTISNEMLAEIKNGQDRILYKRVNDEMYDYTNNKLEKIQLKVPSGKLALSAFSKEEVADVANLISAYTILDVPDGINNHNSPLVVGTPDLRTIDGVVVSLYLKSKKLFAEAVNVVEYLIPGFHAPTILELGKFSNEKDATQDNKAETEGIKNFLVSWGEKEMIQTYTSTSLSGGNMRTIYLIFSLFNAEKNAFFAIEEIENGLHIGRISRLLDQLKTQAINKDLQILFTTHSAEVLDCVISKEVIYCTKDNHNGSRYKLLSETEAYKAIKQDLKDEPRSVDLFNSGMLE